MALTQISTDGIKNGTITNADLASNAAIAGTKIDPDFGSQIISTTGVTNLSGELRANGNVKITNANPKITFTDDNNNDDFEVKNNNGVFTIRDATDSADRLTINSAGRVAINGLTNPPGIFNINTGSGTSIANTLVLSRSGSNDYHGVTLSTGSTQDWSFGQNSLNAFEVYENGAASTTRLTILNGGATGIGTRSPSEKLHVAGNIKATGSLTSGSASTLNGGATIGGDLTVNGFVLSQGTSNRGAILGALSVGYSNTYLTVQPVSGSTQLFLNFNNGDEVSIGHTSGSTLTVNGAIKPKTDSASDLGLTGTRFRAAYVDTYYGDGSNLTGINTDLVSDTTPQLGGNLSTNGNNINFGDSASSADDRATFGAAGDLQIYHDPASGGASFIDVTGSLQIHTSQLYINNEANTERLLRCTQNGSVELYHDSVKTFQTTSFGAETIFSSASGDTSIFKVLHGNLSQGVGIGYHSIHAIGANTDVVLNLMSKGSSDLSIQTSAGENMAVFTPNGAAKLYHNNTHTFSTTDYGASVSFNSPGGTTPIFKVLHANQSQGVAIGYAGVVSTGSNANVTLNIRSKGTNNVDISTSTDESMAKFIPNGAVELYHDNLIRLETTTVGMTVTSEGNTPVVQWEGASNNPVGKIDCDQVSPTQSHMRFYTENNGSLGERIRLKHNNAIMINTTSNPTSNAEGYVNMIVDQGRDGFNIRHNHNGNCLNLWRANGDGGLIHFYRGNSSQTAVGNISVNSSSTSYNSGSDYRLKENVTPISDGITRLKTLKPSRFNFIADAETTVDGFLAHEVTAVPEAITGTKDEVDSKGNPVYQCIDQSKLVPLLVAAVQELITKVEALEAG